jgi:hypothetical protein
MSHRQLLRSACRNLDSLSHGDGRLHDGFDYGPGKRDCVGSIRHSRARFLRRWIRHTTINKFRAVEHKCRCFQLRHFHCLFDDRLYGRKHFDGGPLYPDRGLLFGPDLTGAVSGQSLITSDVALQPLSGGTLGSGTTVGLGHVLFSVAANASPGSYAIDLTPFPATSLSDFSGNAIKIDTLSAGQITITGASSVPEPSSIFLFLPVLPIALVIRKAQLVRVPKSRTAPVAQCFCETGLTRSVPLAGKRS